MGLLSMGKLPFQEYPTVVTPIFRVQVIYPSASPELVETEVVRVIENALAEMEGLSELQSESRTGVGTIGIFFKEGADVTKSMALIRDKLSTIASELPKDAKAPRITTDIGHTTLVNFSVTGDRYQPAELFHQARLRLQQILNQVPGVSSVYQEGAFYTMAVLVDREKLYQHGLDGADVYNAIESQNISLPAGKYRESVPITFQTRVTSVSDLENLPLKKINNNIIRLKDVAKVSLQEDGLESARVGGKPGLLISLRKALDGNPLETSAYVREHFQRFQEALPEGMKLHFTFDATKFIKASLDSVEASIFEAVFLVLLVSYLFLGSWRSTLIPLITIPISLVGILFVMELTHASLNVVTLLAMVLAVGLVVDDAIIVLENIHRHMEKGLTPLKAADVGGREVGFSIIAMTITLTAVYLPIMFMEGSLGQVFKEFAITLAGAVLLSGMIAITFSPLMCAYILRTTQKKERNRWLTRFQNWLNTLTQIYTKWLSRMIHKPLWAGGATLLFLVFCIVVYRQLPVSVVPQEDRGVVGLFMKKPENTTPKEFETYIRKGEKLLYELPEVMTPIVFVSPEQAVVVTEVINWSKRSRSANDIVAELHRKIGRIPSVKIFPWSWNNTIPGLPEGASYEGQSQIVLKTAGEYEDLHLASQKLMEALQKAGFQGVQTDLQMNAPSLTAHVDWNRLLALDIDIARATQNTEIMMDKNTAHKFTMDGQRYAISLKASESTRHIEEVYVKNAKDRLTSLGNAVTLEKAAKPSVLTHHNKLRASKITAHAPAGMDLKKALDHMLKLARENVPGHILAEPSSFSEKMLESSQNMTVLIFLALLFIFAILSVLFANFLDPFIILFTVPLSTLGSLLAIWAVGIDLNIYVQVGLVTLVGLITKHGILIVDFTNKGIEAGLDPAKAVLQSAQTRLRPILMTTAAMMMGALPLALTTGAGAEARRSIGFTLLGGLGFGTVLTLFIIPTLLLWLNQRSFRRG